MSRRIWDFCQVIDEIECFMIGTAVFLGDDVMKVKRGLVVRLAKEVDVFL